MIDKGFIHDRTESWFKGLVLSDKPCLNKSDILLSCCLCQTETQLCPRPAAADGCQVLCKWCCQLGAVNAIQPCESRGLLSALNDSFGFTPQFPCQSLRLLELVFSLLWECFYFLHSVSIFTRSIIFYFGLINRRECRSVNRFITTKIFLWTALIRLDMVTIKEGLLCYIRCFILPSWCPCSCCMRL